MRVLSHLRTSLVVKTMTITSRMRKKDYITRKAAPTCFSKTPINTLTKALLNIQQTAVRITTPI